MRDFHPETTVLPYYGRTVAKFAVDTANRSSCQKSKRGVVIVTAMGKVISGRNEPPAPFECDGSCKNVCNKVAVHAEERALLRADKLFDTLTHLVHVKTVDGLPVPSGQPSCWQCSRMIVECNVQNVWLLHSEGWKRYDGHEFHRMTLANTVY